MDVVKPVLRVLLHADFKGWQAGSAAGLVLTAPYALYKSQPMTIGGAACMSGACAIVGSGLIVVRAATKMISMSKDEIAAKASELELSKVDKACLVTGGIGFAAGLNRLAWLAKKDDAPFVKVLASKRGAWAMMAYFSLGVGSCFSVYLIVKVAKTAASRIRAEAESRSTDEGTNLLESNGTAEDDHANGGAADAVNDVVDAVTEK